jgi:hypothetical protein
MTNRVNCDKLSVMAKGAKRPFKLDMDPDEFLERAIRTKPSEVDALIERGKQKKPPGSKAKRKPSGGSDQPESVVDLRHRRMRKRNDGR